MRVDIYRRAEEANLFSYLAVPEGKVIPQEATATDWQAEATSVELDDNADVLPVYHIEGAEQQIQLKGYAITGLKDMSAVTHPHP